jgi:EH domain-containing protein 1
LYDFASFHAPTLHDGDFESKPTVLFLGQYSTGKTTFIEYLLEAPYRGSQIGPEPTTDKFCAVYHANEERTIPGNALAVQADMPFRGLQKFGTAFLNRFQGSTNLSPLLENFTFIDTPGVLSGEKQRIARGYDYPAVIQWFATRADMILLLFDAHKLDVSDEFKDAIRALKGNDEKIRLVLNKADRVNGQQLMRVYGALMWSLGKVFDTPEVSRVYIGSFWDQPYQCTDHEKLFDAEREDLFRDLLALPRGSAVRKVNELVKRARLVRVHALIIGHLKAQMPAVFGKDSKKDELIKNLGKEFQKIQQQYQIPVGDFPDLATFKEQLKNCDFNKFNKLDEKLVNQMDEVLATDIPKLMKMFPEESAARKVADRAVDGWLVTPVRQQRYGEMFDKLPKNDAGLVTGDAAKPILVKSGLSFDLLGQIWQHADNDSIGSLDREQFMVAMYLVDNAVNGEPVPKVLPPMLIPASRRPKSGSSNPFG